MSEEYMNDEFEGNSVEEKKESMSDPHYSSDEFDV